MIRQLSRHISVAGLCSLFVLGATLTNAEISPTSPNWERAITQFEEKDKTQAPLTGGVLFIGSSSIRMWKDLADDFPTASVINRGFGGSQIVDSIYFADRIVIPYQPAKIFLYAGDNDVAKGKSASTVLGDFQRFAAKVHAKLPKTQLYFIAIKPSLKRWNLAPEMEKANHLVQQFAQTSELIHYVDIWTPMLGSDGKPLPGVFLEDGLHMNRAGYDIWAKVIAPLVSQ